MALLASPNAQLVGVSIVSSLQCFAQPEVTPVTKAGSTATERWLQAYHSDYCCPHLCDTLCASTVGSVDHPCCSMRQVSAAPPLLGCITVGVRKIVTIGLSLRPIVALSDDYRSR